MVVALEAKCASKTRAAHTVGKADKLTIAYATAMIADLARQVAGEAVEKHDDQARK